jgi:hypothetical protein
MSLKGRNDFGNNNASHDTSAFAVGPVDSVRLFIGCFLGHLLV